jgi:hypothetical protein
LAHHSKEVVVIPDPEDMIEMAKTVERTFDDHGWDCAPLLGTIADVGDSYQSRPFPIQPWDVDPDDPAGALVSIATEMMKQARLHHRLTDAMGVSHLSDLTVGVWFTFEAWSGAMGDIEVRACVLVDCGGWVYEAIRRRGEEPKTTSYEPGQDAGCGGILDGLRRMLLAIGSGMSTGTIDMEKVGMAGVGRS